MKKRNLHKDAEEIFRSALKAVDPERLVRLSMRLRGASLSIGSRAYDLNDFDRVLVIGAGKASAAMARAVEKILRDRISEGVVVVKYGHTVPLKKIRVIEAGHPVPDKKSLEGGHEVLKILSESGEKDLVVCLLSGGGSALMDDFQAGITLADAGKATSLLLASGAAISEINTIRKHISRVKGGRLAAAASPSPMVSMILSDVIGDELDVIASGPTVPDPTTFAQAWGVLEKYDLLRRVPKRILDYIKEGLFNAAHETPKPKNRIFKNVYNLIVGNNQTAVSAAASRARRLGYHPLILTTAMQGEAREAAKCLAAVAKEVAQHDRPVKKPACLIAGGETTVTLRGKGKGGRNQEMALAAALEISGRNGIVFLNGGTDGTDGPTDAAGAWVDDTTMRRARPFAMDIQTYLDANNSYRFFKKLGGHIMTGPTLTNVMDLTIILVV